MGWTRVSPIPFYSFPLFTKGKNRIQFNYAVYLLNKNIAQLRWLCGQNTADLRETLSNLSSFLQNRKLLSLNACKKATDSELAQSKSKNETNSVTPSDKLAKDNGDQNRMQKRPGHSRRKDDSSLSSQTELVIPEAFMSQEISPNAFKTYMKEKINKMNSKSDNGVHRAYDYNLQKPVEDITVQEITSESLSFEGIETGTDILQSCSEIHQVDGSSTLKRDPQQKKIKQKRRISRSVGSIGENLNQLDAQSSLELGKVTLVLH